MSLVKNSPPLPDHPLKPATFDTCCHPAHSHSAMTRHGPNQSRNVSSAQSQGTGVCPGAVNGLLCKAPSQTLLWEVQLCHKSTPLGQDTAGQEAWVQRGNPQRNTDFEVFQMLPSCISLYSYYVTSCWCKVTQSSIKLINHFLFLPSPAFPDLVTAHIIILARWVKIYPDT